MTLSALVTGAALTYLTVLALAWFMSAVPLFLSVASFRRQRDRIAARLIVVSAVVTVYIFLSFLMGSAWEQGR